MVLPLKVCEELLQVMDDSNSTLPASMRCMRSYEVRRLPCIVKPYSLVAYLYYISKERGNFMYLLAFYLL